MQPLILTLLGIVLLALLLYFAFCTVLLFLFLRRQPDDPASFLRTMEGTPKGQYIPTIREERDWYNRHAKEDVWIESDDGLRLHGVLFSNPAQRGVAILCHGFHSSSYADFSCAFRPLYDMGFSLLAIDQRAHSQSEGTWLTMGVKERMDVRDWCIWTLERFGEKTPVLLEGMSMGAATVLMAAGLDLPPNVRAVCADCGYTSPRDIFASVLKRAMHLPAGLLFGADLCCRALAGFSIDGADAREALKHTRLPVLLIHGEADDFVPCEMSRQNFAAAAGEKELITVPGATHGMSFLVERERVEQEWKAFIETHIG